MYQKSSDIPRLESDRPADAVYTSAMYHEVKRSMLTDLVRVLLNEIESMDQMPSGKRTLDFYEEVKNFERSLIEQALNQSKGNQTKAARMLGMKKSTLNDKIKIYDISMKQFGTHPLTVVPHNRARAQDLDDQTVI